MGIDASLFLAVRRGWLDRFSSWGLGMLLNHLIPPECFTPRCGCGMAHPGRIPAS